MRATATPVDDTHVQLTIEIDEAELSKEMDDTARQISREVSIKGFRKGKAPRRVIEAYLGGAARLRTEAIRGAATSYYAKGISEAELEPIDQPELDVASGEQSGPVVYQATVEIRPNFEIADYHALRVTIPSPVVYDDEVDAQIERILEADAELRDVDRPLQMDDQVVVDVSAVDPAGELDAVELTDFSYRLGTDAVAEGIDTILVGHANGDVVEAMGRIKDDDKERGEFRLYTVTLKRISEVVLPELTDEWVEENTDFASVEALREGVMTQLRRMKVVEAQMSQRDAMLAAVAELIAVEALPESLVNTELQYRVSEFTRRLSERGISPEYYLQVTGQSGDQLIGALREDAVQAVRVDLALRALVRAEGLEATPEEIEQELDETAASMKVKVDALRKSLDENGRRMGFAVEVAKLKASKWLMEHVIYVDANGNEIDRTLLEPAAAEAELASSDEPSTDADEDAETVAE